VRGASLARNPQVDPQKRPLVSCGFPQHPAVMSPSCPQAVLVVSDLTGRTIPGSGAAWSPRYDEGAP
jgi:hypothetical protein